MMLSTYSYKEAVPAKLGLLAIYNPSLGSTEESLENQIVYYYSSCNTVLKMSRRRVSRKQPQDNHDIRQQMDEQLRQVGLAQGMIEFAKNFSGEKPVDFIDTEKTRIILHEFEPGWWILASINLTILPVFPYLEQQRSIEYSSRDVKPAKLLLVDLLQAHSTFLLHHASSMTTLFMENKRSKVESFLIHYWDTFVSRWNVIMHGNPVNNLYRGIKIAGCGELGMGVGEEHRGSGEREVLEGFTRRLKGMVDVVASRFDDKIGHETPVDSKSRDVRFRESWIGLGNEPGTEDGAIFLGTGALSRKSLRDITHWIEDLYRWGTYTYGVFDDPDLSHRPKVSRKNNIFRAKQLNSGASKDIQETHGFESQARDNRPKDLDNPNKNVQSLTEVLDDISRCTSQPALEQTSSIESLGDRSIKTNYLVDYLKLGYGKYWSVDGIWSKNETGRAISHDSSLHNLNTSDQNRNSTPSEPVSNELNNSRGCFLIGLVDHINDIKPDLRPQPLNQNVSTNTVDFVPRITHRKLTLELEHKQNDPIDAVEPASNKASGHSRSSSKTSFETQDSRKTERLQVVVYIAKPFIFVFFFRQDTDILESPDLYYSLHHELEAILKPLLTSTNYRASKPEVTGVNTAERPIYDLIWDPRSLKLISTVPNIPDFFELATPYSLIYPWSLAEALNTHMQIVTTCVISSDNSSELERLCKTSQGWWIVWTRVVKPVFQRDRLRSPELICKSNSMTKNGTETPDKQGVISNESRASTFITSTISESSHSFTDTTFDEQNSNGIEKEIILVRRIIDDVTKSNSILPIAPILGSERHRNSESIVLSQGIGINTRRYIKGLLNLSS